MALRYRVSYVSDIQLIDNAFAIDPKKEVLGNIFKVRETKLDSKGRERLNRSVLFYKVVNLKGLPILEKNLPAVMPTKFRSLKLFFMK